MKDKTKRKIKVRLLQLVVIILTVVVTKVSINYTTELRGYNAIGGEYLIPFIGLFVVVGIEEVYKKRERRRMQKRGKHRSKRK